MRHVELPRVVNRAGKLLLAIPFLLFALILSQMGCGGGSSSSAFVQPPPPPPPSASFTISVSPSSVTLDRGTTSSPLVVSIGGTNGFAGNVNVSLSGLPAGVSSNPAGTFSVETGASRPIILGISATTATGNFTLGVQGISGSLSEMASLSLKVQAAVQLIPPSRTGFVRNDVALVSDSIVGEAAHRRIVYDAVGRRIFVANRLMNFVDVLSTEQELIARINVPEPSSVDFSANGKKIWVGSSVEQMASIDATDLQAVTITLKGIVTPQARFSLPQEIVPLSNGSMLVNLRQAGTLNSRLARWDPGTNTFVELAPSGLGAPGAMARSGDHTKVLVGASNSTGEVFLYEAQSNSFTRSAQFSGSTPALLAANKDGTRYAVYLNSPSGSKVVLLDGTLMAVAFREMTVAWGLAFSPDGRFLYISENSGEPAVITILDATNGQVIGRIFLS